MRWLGGGPSGGPDAPDYEDVSTVYGSDVGRMAVSGNEAGITVYGSDVARMTVSGNEAGIEVDGTDTARITITGGV